MAAYAGLMTDEYPPFRLDQGPHEPQGRMVMTTGAPPSSAPPSQAPTAGGAASAAPPVRRGGWSAGSVITVIIGCVAALTSLTLVTGGVAALVADGVGRDADGYLTSQTESFTSDGSAVLFGDIRLDTAGASWVPERLIGDVRVTVTPSDRTDDVFFGIGPAADVSAMLGGTAYTEARGPGLGPRQVSGSGTSSAPVSQGFWDASASGAGRQVVTWSPRDGDWSAVVMNPDGSTGLSADVTVGATFPWLLRLGLGLLLAGLVVAATGAALITLALGQVSREGR